MIQDLKLISFSGGRTSAFMTNELLKDQEYSDQSIIVFCNTGKENEGTLKFINDCDKLWQNKVVWLEYSRETKFKIVNYYTASRSGEPFEELINKRKFLPNIMVRYCTQELKIRVIKHYLISLGYKHWTNVIGIRYDEPKRWSKIKEATRKERYETDLPLVKWKITKKNVLDYWAKMPFDLEISEDYGNCDLCFLKGKHKKIKIIKEHPELSIWWREQEEKHNARFRNDYTTNDLIKMAQAQKQQLVFDFDDDIQCFCNSD
jgi:hypothetical protein